jgi:hypothetical protein
MTAAELNDFVYQANLERNFLSNPKFVRGDFSRALELFNDIVWRNAFHVVALYCIMQCYKGLGNEDEAKRAEQQMREKISTDNRAADMFTKYRHLMPAFKLEQEK